MNFLTIPPLSYSFWLLLAAFGKLRHISPEGDTENLFTLPKDSTKTESASRLSASSADGPALAKLGLALTILCTKKVGKVN